jgi:ADP-ribosylglycohydrolase
MEDGLVVLRIAPDHSARLERAAAALEGLSVGDAFGERYFTSPAVVESLVASRALAPAPWSYTDDTEMAIAIFEVLSRYGRIFQDALASTFASRYAFNPYRGYGATAHEILKSIAEGEPWKDASARPYGGSGSMGNGAAMRVAPVGAYFGDSFERAATEARASAEVTHAHPEGKAGAVAAAVATAWAWQRGQGDDVKPGEMFAAVLEHIPAGATKSAVERAAELPLESSVEEAVRVLGNGSRVIAEDTVPFALWCAARHLSSYEEAIWTAVSGLGDRDTTCAIAGGIVVFTSKTTIPETWSRSREPLRMERAAAR